MYNFYTCVKAKETVRRSNEAIRKHYILENFDVNDDDKFAICHLSLAFSISLLTWRTPRG